MNRERVFQNYRGCLSEKIGRIRVFGQEQAFRLEKVFVELSLYDKVRRGNSAQAALELMDQTLRQRRDLFARSFGSLNEMFGGDQVRGTIRPDSLLKNPRSTLLVGAPGCGKTTLMRHLCLASYSRNDRFPLYLEFKTLSEPDLRRADGDLVRLFISKGLQPLTPSEAELPLLVETFRESILEGRASIFLDGLDEIKGQPFFRELLALIENFTKATDNAIFVSTRPYALDFEWSGPRQYEIAPLAQTQILDFLFHYYGEQELTLNMAKAFRARRELADFANTPFLLAVLAHLWKTSGPVGPDRLHLYHRIVRELVIRLDRDKGVTRFLLPDPNGDRKREFLTELAFESIFREQVSESTERFIFSRDDIVRAARTRFQEEAESFADDVIATPLLKVIGPDLYAFSHLTIQEYLAAVALSRHPDAERMLPRGIFNAELAETEVLPMTLGLLPDPDRLYATLEKLPESFTWVNLRIRARGLAYISKLGDSALAEMFAQYQSIFLSGEQKRPTDSIEIVRRAFAQTGPAFRDHFVDRLRPLFETASDAKRSVLIQSLQLFSSDQAVPLLRQGLWHTSEHIARESAWALSSIGSEAAVLALVEAMSEATDRESRRQLAEIVGGINSEAAIEPIQALLESSEENVRERAVAALGKMRVERAVSILISRLDDPDPMVRGRAAIVLGRGKHHLAVPFLSEKVRNETDEETRSRCALALGEIGAPEALPSLLAALDDRSPIVRAQAVTAIGELADLRTIEPLILRLADSAKFVANRANKAISRLLENANAFEFKQFLTHPAADFRMVVVQTLSRIEARWTRDLVLSALSDPSAEVAKTAAEFLYGDERAEGMPSHLAELSHTDPARRLAAFTALVELNEHIPTRSLLFLGCDPDERIRAKAVQRLTTVSEPILYGECEKLFGELYSYRCSIPQFLKEDEVATGIFRIMKNFMSDEAFFVIHANSPGSLSPYGFHFRVLKEIAPAGFLDVYEKELFSKGASEKPELVELIAAVGNDRAVALLGRIFRELPPATAVAAAFALKNSGGSKGESILRDAFRSGHPEKKTIAAVALADEAVDGLLEFLLTECVHAWAFLVKHWDTYQKRYRGEYHDEEETPLEIWLTLGEDDPESRPALPPDHFLGALHRISPKYRVPFDLAGNRIQEFSNLDAEDISEGLLLALRMGEAKARESAAHYLPFFGTGASVLKALEQSSLEDPNDKVRRTAQLSLASLKQKHALFADETK